MSSHHIHNDEGGGVEQDDTDSKEVSDKNKEKDRPSPTLPKDRPPKLPNLLGDSRPPNFVMEYDGDDNNSIFDIERVDNPRIKPGTKNNQNGKKNKNKKKDINIHNIFSDKGDWRHRTRHLRHHSTMEERRRELYPTDTFPKKWSYEARLCGN